MGHRTMMTSRDFRAFLLLFSRRLLVFIAICACLSGAQATSSRYQGALVLGTESYDITLSVNPSRRSADRIDLEILIRKSSHPVASGSLHLTPQGGVLLVNDQSYAVPKDLALEWWKQLTVPGAVSPRSPFTHVQDPVQLLRTKVVSDLAPGLPGKAQLSLGTPCPYPCSPREVRIFSLGEWDNLYRDYVSLGLVAVPMAVEGNR